MYSDTIEVVWSVEDVLEVDDTLTKLQAQKVLLKLKQFHDATIGINWEVIDTTIDVMRCGGELD